jgi:hypothetical protein
VRLFSGLPGVRGVDETSVAPAADARVAIGSLPMHFGTTPATIPTFGAYLRAPTKLSSAWRDRLRPLRVDGRRLVGLAWAGNPAQAEDRWRSLRFTELSPLLQSAGTRFVSLQKGHAATQPSASEILDFSADLDDFADTAAVVAQLDLVIAVDTSVAHLAGALGKPTWTLVRFAADWRWAVSGDDTAWYPSMRLFRQAARGQWAPVVADVADALKHLVSARREPGSIAA